MDMHEIGARQDARAQATIGLRETVFVRGGVVHGPDQATAQALEGIAFGQEGGGQRAGLGLIAGLAVDRVFPVQMEDRARAGGGEIEGGAAIARTGAPGRGQGGGQQ